MANKLYEENYIKDIADAIREKTNIEGSLTVSQMAGAIRSIRTCESSVNIIDDGEGNLTIGG
mgnify:CR=1 FL=1